LTCWLPNWHVRRQQREPEAGIINRLIFASPVEQEIRVRIERGKEATAQFLVYEELFED
jgi:hypothetical protein